MTAFDVQEFVSMVPKLNHRRKKEKFPLLYRTTTQKRNKMKEETYGTNRQELHERKPYFKP